VFQDAAGAFWLAIQQQRDRVAVRVHPKVIYAWPSPINAVKKCRHIKQTSAVLHEIRIDDLCARHGVMVQIGRCFAHV
jgi:hypothetical protein